MKISHIYEVSDKDAAGKLVILKHHSGLDAL